VKGFARRRPGVFIGIAVGAGVVVGRLVRALAQPSDDDSSGGSRRYATYGNGDRASAGTRTGTSYGRTGTLGTSGATGTGTTVPGETTVVTGTVGGAAADPLAGETWTEGGTTTSRDGL